ncbi:leucine-rich repeat domain-containing protein [Sporobolomyces koalae]|uniref:leucine-rich repeat domain-containing protein n=1 Tax=Sporobolomyces koalae TaxID=500713 RepID=UPI003176A3C1
MSLSSASITAAAASSSRTEPLRSPHASISGPAYLSALSKFISTHEAALAAYYAPRSSVPTRTSSNGITSSSGPSWGTILTLGILPDPAAFPASSPSPSVRRDPLVLHFDPHHLYYILLKFDELGLSTGDALDVKVEGGYSTPMTVDHTTAESAGTVSIVHDGTAATPSVFAGMLGFGSSSTKQDDSRSVRSSKSSFSFGSGWWGLGHGGGGPRESDLDEPTQVRHIYSSCTKLPALKLSPFVFSPASSSNARSSSSSQPPAQAVEGFEDCPPPSTCVPLSLFHSLTSLYLQDLDPRAFVGWHVLSIQLKKLEVVRGGIEDVGELICDCVVEDEQRNKRQRAQETFAFETVGHDRKRRTADSIDQDGSADSDPYPPLSKLAWSSLRHLSLHDNSLTFVPAPPFAHLSMLASLDLSSNLLISVPPALSSLPSLRSLNLRDNMIDNLHSLPTILGAIEVLNLSHNRLESLSGLDRLLALERLDLRGNRIWETLEVSRLARLPNLRELWIKENPFSRDRELGGEEGWRIKCLAYFQEERSLVETDQGRIEIKIDGRAIDGRTEKKAVDAEVAKRAGGAFVPDRTLRRRVSAEVDARNGSRAREASSNGFDSEVGPKKVVVEPRRRVVTAPLSTAASGPRSSSRQRHSTNIDVSPAPSLSSSPVSGHAIPASPQSKPAKRRKPRRIVDLDAPLPNTLPQSSNLLTSTQQSDSDAATTASSGLEGGKTILDSNSTLPSTPVKRHQKFASSPSHVRVSPARDAFSSLGPSTSPTRSKIDRRERISATTYEAPGLVTGESNLSSGGEGTGAGGGGEALRRKIEKLREEVGENWLSVLGEREARASQQQQQQQQQQQKGKEPEVEQPAEVVQPVPEPEAATDRLAVSAGVKVVKKKTSKKKKKLGAK